MFTCPRCGCTSHHPTDAAEGYCGRCHDWTRPTAAATGPAATAPSMLVQAAELHAAGLGEPADLLAILLGAGRSALDEPAAGAR